MKVRKKTTHTQLQEWVDYQCDSEQTSVFTEMDYNNMENVYQKGDLCLKLLDGTAAYNGKQFQPSNSFMCVM